MPTVHKGSKCPGSAPRAVWLLSTPQPRGRGDGWGDCPVKALMQTVYFMLKGRPHVASALEDPDTTSTCPRSAPTRSQLPLTLLCSLHLEPPSPSTLRAPETGPSVAGGDPHVASEPTRSGAAQEEGAGQSPGARTAESLAPERRPVCLGGRPPSWADGSGEGAPPWGTWGSSAHSVGRVGAE